MADEFFQAHGESWWINSTKNICSLSSIHEPIIGQYFAWPNEFLDMKNNSFINDDYNSNTSDDSMVFQELTKNDQNLLVDSTLQILDINGNSSSSSSSQDWNHSLQEVLTNSSQNYQHQNELMRNFSSISNQDFTNYYSNLIQTLFDSANEDHNQEQQPQQSLFANNNNPPINDFEPSLPKSNIEEIGESKSRLSIITKNSTNEPTYKRQRIETPSPLPTFKVRKEKLGDRITALQQLVSPFGKTDTASVLQEAIDYINFLHDQVNVLRTQFVKNGSSTQHQQVKEQEGLLKRDLRSKGLCLVPISSTFPIVAETTMDFWTPTFGGTFR
ncbi:transcription factor isoform X1 [Capsicum annuum]|uniref:transcription factor bHLH112 isoform X1 n=1 Tax=Capsicum annuum TaxID=4072 RepID=UPI001FB120AE|nr:transcription factor bHLH112 isoform X1 [Capsicum annuum]